jgi:urocanate hydratase
MNQRSRPEGAASRRGQQEAPLRILENNLHPGVAQKPVELIVHGGSARLRETTRASKPSAATLLVQSGSPIAVVETHEVAPRVPVLTPSRSGRSSTRCSASSQRETEAMLDAALVKV